MIIDYLSNIKILFDLFISPHELFNEKEWIIFVINQNELSRQTFEEKYEFFESYKKGLTD